MQPWWFKRFEFSVQYSTCNSKVMIWSHYPECLTCQLLVLITQFKKLCTNLFSLMLMCKWTIMICVFSSCVIQRKIGFHTALSILFILLFLFSRFESGRFFCLLSFTKKTKGLIEISLTASFFICTAYAFLQLCNYGILLYKRLHMCLQGCPCLA